MTAAPPFFNPQMEVDFKAECKGGDLVESLAASCGEHKRPLLGQLLSMLVTLLATPLLPRLVAQLTRCHSRHLPQPLTTSSPATARAPTPLAISTCCAAARASTAPSWCASAQRGALASQTEAVLRCAAVCNLYSCCTINDCRWRLA